MSVVGKILSALSKTEYSDLSKVKSAISARFLQAAPAVAVAALGTRAFRLAADLAPSSNVIGVGIDEKYVAGIPTGVAVIKFLVRSKVAPSALSKSELLPTKIDGFETDVEETGPIVPLAKKKPAATAAMPNPRLRIRPAQPGSSVGFREPNNQFVMAGTFGLVVKDAAGKKYLLSNNHVIAHEAGYDASGVKHAPLPVGAPIFQPGLLDGGQVPADKIAELTRWVNLRADRTDNKVDGAIALLKPSTVAIPSVLYLGTPNGAASAARDMIVHKFGRTTSYRAGRVSSVTFDVTIPYDVGNVVFEDQIAIRGLNNQRFSDSGDSGSAILERGTNKVVGLLFAGATNGSLTFGNHIADVLSQLKIKLV